MSRHVLWYTTSDCKVQYWYICRLREEAARRSVLMKDQPDNPKDVAVYWTEYVMRHHGAPHLRCPAMNMSWSVLLMVVLSYGACFKLDE